MEIRPAAELGPIILCLDTSGSMRGARETVAKALALECLRGAHRQERKCFLYAFRCALAVFANSVAADAYGLLMRMGCTPPFVVHVDGCASPRRMAVAAMSSCSHCVHNPHHRNPSGPGDVVELELTTGPGALDRLLHFLQMSFQGGTDVDKPLELSLERLGREEWAQADILMVTDGEISPPKQDTLQRLRVAHDSLGLEVHGLIVAPQVTPAMEELCTHVHVFKSWSTVGSMGVM